MSKGARKSKLRDYSNITLTSEEKSALLKAATALEQHSIVAAVLGHVIVEHELDALLRRRLTRKDDKTWERLTAENGPLRSFYAKIELAYGLGTVNDKVRNDLHIVRAVRNAFAHSRKILDFNDELIVAELGAANCMPRKWKKDLKAKPPQYGKGYFAALCLRLVMALIKKVARAERRKLKRYMPYVSALAPFLTPLPQEPGSLGAAGTGLLRQLAPHGHSESPNPPPQPGLLGEQLLALAKKYNNTDK